MESNRISIASFYDTDENNGRKDAYYAYAKDSLKYLKWEEKKDKGSETP